MTYYETPPQTDLVVPAGGSDVFPVAHPNRVRITALRVQQTAGTPVDFKVDLYNRDVRSGHFSDSGADLLADDFWLVTPPGGIAANAPGMLWAEFSGDVPFFINRDDPVYVQAQGQNSPSLVSMMANRVIYARITNLGANAATFRLIIGSENRGSPS